ncbi:4Fe-4S binding protein [Candidatus Bipolaricaulota bacterium]|nr:4Fe-4S binding protein [Candidatus Bipolaricaulota bacterium]
MKTKEKPEKLSDLTKTPSGKAGSFKLTDVSGWKTFKPVLDEDKCINCLQCWVYCPHGVIERTSDDQAISIDLQECKGCGICADVCPTDAIEMNKIRGVDDE